MLERLSERRNTDLLNQAAERASRVATTLAEEILRNEGVETIHVDIGREPWHTSRQNFANKVNSLVIESLSRLGLQESVIFDPLSAHRDSYRVPPEVNHLTSSRRDDPRRTTLTYLVTNQCARLD